MAAEPVIIVGAGPQGLAAAAHLVERGREVLVVEQGEHAGAAVAEWGHVRLFSAWPELIDAAARRLLESAGVALPGEGYPTGVEWVTGYLLPLADALAGRVRLGVRVTGITRRGRDRVVDDGRDQAAFVVHGVDATGQELRLPASAVLDASGTWGQPGPAGADGLPAVGEAAAADRITYRIPDDVSWAAGQRVLVVGAGHSATHAVLRLADLARTSPETRVIWALRRGEAGAVFGGAADDGLPERAALGRRAREAIDTGSVELLTGFRIAEMRREHGEGTLTVVADDGRSVAAVAHVFALTGFRPDLSFLSELRLGLDPVLHAAAGIAAEIDPNIHSCGSVAATGARELAQPEPGFFVIGAKSYGRAPTFLALTGYEQVRSVTAHLAGDREAAARNELVLPMTGVCGGAGGFDQPAAGCCAPLLQIGLAPTPVH